MTTILVSELSEYSGPSIHCVASIVHVAVRVYNVPVAVPVSSIYDRTTFAFGVTRSQRPTHRITYGRAGILRQRRNVLTILKRPRRLNPYRSSPIPAGLSPLSVSQLQPEPRPAAALEGAAPPAPPAPPRLSARGSEAVPRFQSAARRRHALEVERSSCGSSTSGREGGVYRRERQRAPHSRTMRRLSDDATCARRRISVRRSRAKEDYFTLESRNTLQTTRTWAGACTSSAPSESLGRTSIAHDSRSRAPPSLLL